ncbi:MAG: glycoside hydrolase family 38 C-terminal domain-containing protein, partial [Anaerolineales bacterium]
IKSRIRDTKFPEGYRTHDVTVAVPLSIPPLGYTTLSLRAGKPGQPSRYPDTPGLATSERSMANETLSVEIEPNGTLVLTDLRSGAAYRRLLTFEDQADIGDGWFHGMAVNDRAIVSTTARSELSLVHNGPLLATFRIRTWLSVPEAFDFGRMERSERSAEMVIDSLISLRRGQAYLEVETTVANQVNDHRLRVLFPSGAQAATYLADSQYDVVERPIALRADNHLYRELEVETKPQQSWTAVFDDQRGLAIVAEGLLETAVRDLRHRPHGPDRRRAGRPSARDAAISLLPRANFRRA